MKGLGSGFIGFRAQEKSLRNMTLCRSPIPNLLFKGATYTIPSSCEARRSSGGDQVPKPIPKSW